MCICIISLVIVIVLENAILLVSRFGFGDLALIGHFSNCFSGSTNENGALSIVLSNPTSIFVYSTENETWVRVKTPFSVEEKNQGSEMDDANSHWQNMLKRQATGQYFQTYLSLINTAHEPVEHQAPTVVNHVVKIEHPFIQNGLGGNATQLKNVTPSPPPSPSRKKIKVEPSPGRDECKWSHFYPMRVKSMKALL